MSHLFNFFMGPEMEEARYKLTAEKLEELQVEIQFLETDGRKKVADSLGWLRTISDGEDDYTFSDLLDDKKSLEKRIQELKTIVKNAEVSDETDCESISIGNRVRVRLGTTEREYTLVSSLEADPISGKVSDESPIGMTLMGMRVGDTKVFDSAMVSHEITVLEIK